jgi:hypothetical protein
LILNILASGQEDGDQEGLEDLENSLENDDSSVSKVKVGLISRKNDLRSNDKEHMTDENVHEYKRTHRNEYSVAERMAKHKASLASKNSEQEEHDDVVPANSPTKKKYKSGSNSIDFGMAGKRQAKTMVDLKPPLDQLKVWLLEHAAKELLKVRLNDDKVRWLKFACLTETISIFVYLTV